MGRKAVAVVSISHASSTKHVPYICRLEAVRPTQATEQRKPERVHERVASAPGMGGLEREIALKANITHTKEEKAPDLKQFSEEQSVEILTHKVDAVWTWNAPSYVTGDKCGTREQSGGQDKTGQEQAPKVIPERGNRPLNEQVLSLEEKIENARAYFGILSDSEKMKGGINSYRAVLTVGGEASNQKMHETVNDFLRENFPLAQALVALHRNTSHVHAHLYIHPRQLDGKKINLGQDYFHLDEKWAKVCSEHFNDRAIYDDHMRLKSETQKWKRERAKAVQDGSNIPAKGDRWADYYEVKHGVVRTWDDGWAGRLKAVTRVAETKADYLRVANAPEQHIIEADREVRVLQQKLQSVTDKRLHARSEAKRVMPAEVITIEEQKEITQYIQAIRDATTARQLSVNNQPIPLQASFDFMKLPAEQMSFDFYRSGAERVTNKQTDTKDRKSKARSNVKSKATEFQPGRNVAEEFASQKETSFDLHIRQTEAHEREFRAAHAVAVNGLGQIAQNEGALLGPQEFAREQSANLRQTIQEKHGLSIYDLGYTRENWASIILCQVSKALRRESESINHSNSAVPKAEREINSMQKAVEEGTERMLAALAGKNPDSRSSNAFDHENLGNQIEKGWSSVRQKEDWHRTADPTNQAQLEKEQTFELIDHLEHFFSR